MEFNTAPLGKSRVQQAIKIPLSSSRVASGSVSISNFTRKYALVIGNSKYQYYDKLQNLPVNDANDMKHKLEELGFETTLITDVSYDAFTAALLKFYQKIENADIAVVVYSGYGLELNKENYFIPIDKDNITAEDSLYYAISVQRILSVITKKNVKYSIIVANNFSSSRGIGITFPLKVSIPAGIQNYQIGYAMSSGRVTGNGRNSIYIQDLLKNIKKGQRVDDTFVITNANLVNITGISKNQMPVFYNGFSAFLVF